MGLTPGTEVTMMKYAPMGDPLEIRLRGYELTLRKDDAARIELVVFTTPIRVRALTPQSARRSIRPWARETYSPRAAKTAVPEGAPLHFASPATKLRQDHVIQPADGLQPARR